MAKVMVKIMGFVGPHKPGQEVEIEEAVAAQMCAVRKRNNGHGLVDYQPAMLLKDYEAVKAQPVEKGGLTQGELAAMGLKNVVQTPPSPLDAQLSGVPSHSVERDADGDAAAKKIAEDEAAVAAKKVDMDTAAAAKKAEKDAARKIAETEAAAKKAAKSKNG